MKMLEDIVTTKAKMIFWISVGARRKKDVRVVITKSCCIFHAFQGVAHLLGEAECSAVTMPDGWNCQTSDMDRLLTPAEANRVDNCPFDRKRLN
jgi:hypothetical protein